MKNPLPLLGAGLLFALAVLAWLLICMASTTTKKRKTHEH